MKAHWPLLALFLSACLFVLAASYYPGGTTTSATTVGYDWTRNFISSLFAPTALNGAANPARYFAIPAMLLLCLSVGFVFKRISTTTTSKPHRKTIEIGGVGSMVYAFLVVTPMHNLMVTISLLFFVVASLAVLSFLRIGREWRLLFTGLVCLVLLFVAAFIYYGNVLYGVLPVLQKLSFIASTSWLFAVYYRTLRGTTR